MRPETLFARAVLAPRAKAESEKPAVTPTPSSDHRQQPQNLLQRATLRR
ncbi:MAG: hypothetical protein JWM77_2492 [Rhodospirillales bacterium]|nr:hypothetical protein [Rhodospirillales bacterium]